MDNILLAVTVISLGVALVMSIAAWRVTQDEKKRSAARVAALSLASREDDEQKGLPPQEPSREPFFGREAFAARPVAKAPWSAPKIVAAPIVVSAAPVELPLNQARVEPIRVGEPIVSHASGFLGADDTPRVTGNRQKPLAFAAIALFVVLSGGLVWMMSRPEGTSAAAIGPNSPLELVSLSHQRKNSKLEVSGLVRNPVAGKPIERLTAVVFLFDRMGTFVTSSKSNVDFLKLGAGDESPFVVSLDAPETVSRYRVSFRTNEGVVPHVDRRSASPAATAGEQAVNVKLK